MKGQKLINGYQKPVNEMYKLKYMFEVSVDEDNQTEMEEVDVKTINFDKYFPMFCARPKINLNSFKLKESNKDKYEKYVKEFSGQRKRKTGGMKIKRKNNNRTNSYDDITSQEELDDMLKDLFNDSTTDYIIKEIHNYTMILTKEFWGPGSYDKWIRVGWALKIHTKI